MKALTNTDFHFDGQKSVYHGKVRDVYNIRSEEHNIGIRRYSAQRYSFQGTSTQSDSS